VNALAVATALGAAGGLALAARGGLDPNSRVFGPVVSRGPADGNRVYLTFDDGPNPGATARILDILAEARVPAAFFLVGRHVERYPHLARRVAEAGHDLGNHTYRHRKLLFTGAESVRRELGDGHRAIVEATGVTPRLFRAPHGYRNPFVVREARRLGYTTFGWNGAIFDTARPGVGEIRRRVARVLAPGAIILLHDGDGGDAEGDRTQTAAALPGILDDARRRGLVCGRLLELA